MSGAVLEADYVVVGGGSAGCVVANRLSADPSIKVVLLEAGGDDRPLRNPSQFAANLNIYIPAGWTNLADDPKVNWNFVSESDPETGNRTHRFPRGKVLGGSSSINGLMYVRGLPSDYDGWRQLGCAGWSWEDVLPLFRRAENAELGASEWHGADGPLSVAEHPGRSQTMDAVIRAAIEAGLPATTDINGAVQEGVHYTQQTTRKGVRASTAAAYLHPVEHRANLRVETRAQATRVIFDGRRAVAVEFLRDGQRQQVRAKAEVILCGGAVNSPQLLELSGIGDAARLRNLGITPLVDRPAVGENLQDHYTLALQVRLKPGVDSLNRLSMGLPLLGQMARYAVTRRGLLSNSAGTVSGYLRSRPEVDIPDVQVMSSAATVDYAAMARTGRTVLDKEPGLTVGGCIVRPESRGHIHVGSADPLAPPSIVPNYLSAHSDVIGSINMIRRLRNLFRQPSLAAIIERELAPVAGIADDDDTALEQVVRGAGFSAYHPVGTCRMGGDPDSVVDAALRVRGVDGLRVADASIMPRLVSGNTNAACIMIGEKLSDLVLSDRGAQAA